MQSLTQTPYIVCTALEQHVQNAKILADSNKAIFGFITKGAFVQSYNEQSLLIALASGNHTSESVVGFLRYHHRKSDLQTTLYDICVAEGMRRQGVGRALLDQLFQQCQILNRALVMLKCPSRLAANNFYLNYGFELVGSVTPKQQTLNIWQFRLSSESNQQ
jgi:ribosomal protein S18 acetylase RimI-like enzyme